MPLAGSLLPRSGKFKGLRPRNLGLYGFRSGYFLFGMLAGLGQPALPKRSFKDLTLLGFLITSSHNK